ncbi:LOW QUALITY PROTEIN: hypothetical protein ACHAXR_013206 [Thalassiosira sp. AJA248-18]
MSVDAIKSFLLEGLRWSAQVVITGTGSILSSSALPPILLWLIVRFIVVGIACLIFHPILRAGLRHPLLTYLGMTFGDIKLSPFKLKFTIKDIELLPSKSSFLQSIILSIFPSANVHRVANHIDFPESKITVQKISFKIRASSLAGTQDGNPRTNNNSSHPHPHRSIFGAADKSKPSEAKPKRELKMLYNLIPRPIIVVKLNDVSIEIEKAYLAPEPPSQFRTTSLANNQKLPTALPTPQNGEDLPTFHQVSVLEIIKNEEVVEAEKVTLFVERWIDHAVAKLKAKVDESTGLTKSFSFSKGSSNQLDSNTSSQGLEGVAAESREPSVEQQTYDEKMNAWIHWGAERVLHMISFELEHASVMISGAGSEVVKQTRKSNTPRKANLAFARLPRRRRALTVVGADAISVSFSPDKQCNALFCFVGLNTQVGTPMNADQSDADAFTQGSAADVEYAWHTVAHPFHLIAEVKGVLSFLIWSVNYDHYWTTRTLGLNLSSTEIAVSLSPDHLHTVLLHLDDYTDPMSSYNEWIEWIKNTHCKKNQSELSEQETSAYRNNYARIKGVGRKGANSSGNENQLTLEQMKDLESRMTRYEIMSNRCFAMKHFWRIPKANKDLEEFLRNSQSSIRDKGDESCATPLDVQAPFQRLHPTPLHALVTLIRENSSIFAPHVTVESFVQTLHIDFCDDGFGPREKSSMPPISSSITVSELSFGIDQKNTLFSHARGSVDSPRPFLDLYLHIRGCKWDVVDKTTSSLDEELPLFRDRSPVGMVYMSDKDVSSKHVLTFGICIAVTPTLDPEPHFDVAFNTSNLVIVVNPLPLLSAIQVSIIDVLKIILVDQIKEELTNAYLFQQNLIELSDLPFQSPDEMSSDPDDFMDDECMANEASVTPLGVHANITFNVENTQLFFLVDRKKISRGILVLNVNGINIKFESGGMSGKLSILTEPVVLCAGQIASSQFSGGGKIDNVLMPFQPIVDIDGAKLIALGEEDQMSMKRISDRSDPEPTTTLRLNIDLGTESFFFNASPSTIVALFETVSSLEPFSDFLQGEQKAREDERIRLEIQKKTESEQDVKFQREVLARIFKDIDVDGSGELSEDELERVVLKLFEQNSIHGFGKSEDEENQKLPCAERPTTSEVKRERDYLLSIIDQNRTNEITYQEMDNAFFKLANNIDDNNLIPAIKDGPTRLYSDQFKYCDSFLSGPWLRKLVYFDDLKEYSSLNEVYRITGHGGLENSSSFPAPSLWRQGQGIELFWELYTRETGCSHRSLKGQSMSLVQRKLVRALCNYEFAKYCWKTLVQPELYAASDVNGGQDAAHWLLDEDSRPRIKSGVIDRLLKHIQTEVIKEINPKQLANIHYDARLVAVSINASALLSSQTEWFVPEKGFMNPEDDGKLENHKGNQLNFQSTTSASYLNTKHNHLECLIEPYPCYGSVAFRVSPQESNTASVLTKVISQSDPETFRQMILDRDINYVKCFWYRHDRTKSGFLSREETMAVLYSVTEMHWKDEVAGLTSNETKHFLGTFCDLADQEGDEIIPFDNLTAAIQMYTARCYFSGSKEILLKNNIGRELKASTKGNLDDHLMRYSIVSEPDYQLLLDSFISVDDGNSCTLSLSGKLSLVTPGFKMIDDISVSPYQTLMFPLKHKKKGSKQKSRRRHLSASGFSPYLTVVPKSDSLDSITLDVRTCVTIRTEIPIKIRIVRLGKSLILSNKSRKHTSKVRSKKMDLAKKNLMSALRRAVEGAPIVYETSDTEGGFWALPLDVIDSSHYHALLIQWNNSWRDPVLLTKDFLFNPMNIREVSRCHALSGIVVQKERLNVHLPDKHSKTPIASDNKRHIMRRTAWDTSIRVVPFFLLSNSLPFPIVVRTWQDAKENEDEMWDELLLPIASAEMDENTSSDEDLSHMPSSMKGRRTTPEDIHLSSGGGSFGHYSQDHVEIGQTLRLSGVSVRESLFIQVSQHVNSSEEVNFMWTNPMRVELAQLRTGTNQKGLTELPKIILDLGDNCDCLVDVSVESGTRVPVCTIFSPFWIMNKTGSKLEYKISGQRKLYLDSGHGGLPVMIHGSKSQGTNEKYKNVSRAISVIPLETPSAAVANNWWDEISNGILVLPKGAIEEKGQNLVDWSESIDLDAAGTHGEISCKDFLFNVSVDSLAGAFHRSNLISLTPRFIVKNTLHIAISILPLYCGVHDAIRKASQLRQNLKEQDKKRKIDLAPHESTVLYHFHNISRGGIEKPYHWVAFCVNASRFGASFKNKWHLLPVDVIESHYFGEHDGCFDTMCGILEAKVHTSDTGSMLVSLSHAAGMSFHISVANLLCNHPHLLLTHSRYLLQVAPFIIENRSSAHYLRFAQDDADAVVFEVPPMFSCAYTWDSPLGKKKLRAVVVPKAKTKDYQIEEALYLERNAHSDKDRDDEEDGETFGTVDSDDEPIDIEENAKEPLMYSLKKGVTLTARELNKTARYRSPRRKAVFTVHSRSYGMTKVGKQKDLPCPSARESESGQWTMSSNLFAHTRIVAGSKILSFSDSAWLANQVEAGILRKGGNFKSAFCEMNVEGIGLYIMDDFPREVMAVVVRDIQLQKRTGSIETTARVRHFQVDAMLPHVRYPIVIHPLPLGVDRRDQMTQDCDDSSDLIVPGSVDKNECYWMKNEERPVPVFEVACSYVPQLNMTWVPSLSIFLCPLKCHIDVDYILRILGMVINSIYKYQDDTARNLTATSHANDRLKYITRGQLNICTTYIEKLYIAPVYFDVELNIKSDDPDGDKEGDSSLTLHSIAQTTSSGLVKMVFSFQPQGCRLNHFGFSTCDNWFKTAAAVAGVLSWLINVGANFAHVSPCFRYTHVTYTDQYCDIFDLLSDIAISYFVESIKQSYKVVFSMELLGDPSELLHQYKTGVTDLFTKTRDEIAAGGKDGVGKGVTSLVKNVVGGTFFALGKVTGGVADTVDSVTTNDMTSNHLKPKSAASDGNNPDNVIDGVAQGTKFLGQTVAHGIAGLVGNPYRGAKTGTATGVAKGVASGVAGLVTAPFIGALGFVAKTADGIGATTEYLELGVIEARCRPARTVPWGRPMCDNGLSYLKAIGIRVHTVRYQKIRKRIIQKNNVDRSEDDQVTSKEYKRIRAAEERRKNPPRKLISIMHEKGKYHYVTSPTRPKLLADAPGSLVLSHYTATFEETLILRSSDLQLGDTVAINFWNHRGLKSATTRAKPLGVCKLTVGDIYSSVLHLHREQLARKESNLLAEKVTADSLIIPVPQECALFRPCRKQPSDNKDIFDAIGEELAAIEKHEEDKFKFFDSDSSESDSDGSFLNEKSKVKEEDPGSVVNANERLFGSISLSFFPIPW